ncbi:TPA: 30S ribosomal protein S17 [Candidatus Gracilibacteria bacterium]|nr:30S ribosomal protein S17 [Candidatus Gracilibacteria bacterium]HIQ57437.1 30S ribosomal protein S17 [Candidatus Gracilibacteria bacterium]
MKTKSGIVVSAAGDKTIVIRVDSHVKHALYEKRVLKSKKFHAHDENNSCKVGDHVTILECRPLSKMKRWTLVTA